ncbi:MAG: hypothetical protein ACI9K5_000267, partial [Gammaproteobacteria bacterium]
PDNVLVDASGYPHILDFGIARTSGTSGTLSAVLTEEGQLVGTLSYMAPEQLENAADAVTPRVDVYALGVLLFELLLGRLPREIADLPLSRAIALLTMSDTPRAGTLDTSLRGDLDTILGKALEAEPARRYSSAAALAGDLRRHLSHQPITARAPSGFYLAWKFTQRNRGLVAGAVATLLTLIAGTVVALIFANRASSNAERALASENNAINGLLQSAQILIDAGRERDAVTELHLVPEEARGVAWRMLDRAVPYLIEGGAGTWIFMDDEHLIGSEGDALVVHSLLEHRTIRRLFPGEGFLIKSATPTGLAIAESGHGSSTEREYALLDLERETVLLRAPVIGHLVTTLQPIAPSLGSEGEGATEVLWPRAPEISDDGSTILWYTSPTQAEIRVEGSVAHVVRDLGTWEYAHLSPGGRIFVVNRQEVVSAFDVESGALLLRIDGDSRPPGSGFPVAGGVLLDSALEDSSGGRSITSRGLTREWKRVALTAGAPPQEMTDPLWPVVVSPTPAWCTYSRDGLFLVINYVAGAKLVSTETGMALHFNGLVRGPDGDGGWIPPEAWRDAQIASVSPSGHRLAITGPYAAPVVVELDPRKTDPADDPMVLTLRGHAAPAGAANHTWSYEIAISPDGSLIASTAPLDPNIRIWDTRTGEGLTQRERTLDGSTVGSEPLMAFGADGTHLVTSQNISGICDWNLLTGKVSQPTVDESAAGSLRIRIDAFIEALDPAGKLRLSRRAQMKEESALVVSDYELPSPPGRRWRNTPGIEGTAAGLSIHPSLPLVAVVRPEIYESNTTVDRMGSLAVIDTDSGMTVVRRELDYRPRCVAYSPDGSMLAVGTHEGHVLLFEAGRYTQQLDWEAHEDYVYSLVWTPDGTRLVTGSGDETLRIWDTRTRVASRHDYDRWQELRAEMAARQDLREQYDGYSGETRKAARVELILRAHAK